MGAKTGPYIYRKLSKITRVNCTGTDPRLEHKLIKSGQEVDRCNKQKLAPMTPGKDWTQAELNLGYNWAKTRLK